MTDRLRADALIGDYQVATRIGASGIGEVYQVHDKLRGDEGALKMLSSSLGWDKASQERFVQVIQAAPPLDHPNICKILTAGVTDNGRPYVVSELVQGRTLDEVGIGLARSLGDKIKIAIQIAEALEAAHAKGVLHLGLKPANVMLDHHGQIKVLDFVVTQATQMALASRGARAPKQKLTVSTVAYYSPEQVRGERPTRQSDVFSLGSLVYELFTGQAPFSGRSVDDAAKNVLHKQPALLTEQLRNTPPSINEVVLQALAKNPAERYQTAGEFAAALKQFAREEEDLRLANPKAYLTGPLDGPDKPNVFRKLIQSKVVNWSLGLTLFIFALIIWSRRPVYKAPQVPAEPFAFTRLTTSRKVHDAALSPDGVALAYAIEDGDRNSLFYRLVEEKRERLVLALPGVEISGVTFSPANDFIYYLKTTPTARELHRVSFNGANQPLLAQVDSPVTFSPNSKELAFVRRNGATTQLIISKVKEPTERILATRQSPAQFMLSNPAWSRDGKTIVCAVKQADKDLTLDLVSFVVESGAEKLLATAPWAEIGRLAWLPGDAALLVNGRDLGAPTWQIWQVAPATGQRRALSVGVNDYHGLSLSYATTQLVTINYLRESGIWLGTDEEAQQLTSGADDGMAGLTWSSKNQLVYASRANKQLELWQKPTEQGQPALLSALRPADTTASFYPASAGDGKGLIFVAATGEQAALWQAEADGTQLRQLSKGPLALMPQFAPDGQQLIYSTLANGKAALALLNVAGGEPAVLLHDSAWGGVLSPNGQQVTANYFDVTSATWKIGVFPSGGPSGGGPSSGGKATTLLDLPGTAHRVLGWTPAGDGIVYIVTKRGVSNLWQQPLKAGAPAALTKFTKQRLYNFAWSPNGQQLAVARGNLTSDAVLINGWNEAKPASK